MNEEKKKNKKKVLTFYLVLAACILVIAAITVTTIFAVNDWGQSDIVIDNGNDNTTVIDSGDTDNSADDGSDTADAPTVTPDDSSDGGDEPVSTDDTFAMPVTNVNLVTSYEFGKDVTLGHYHFHTGLDLAADAGTEVMACLDGTVTAITEADGLDGATVTLSHDDGLTTVYTFVDKVEGLEVGDSVKRGEVIGTVSEACGKEYKVGAHLHFEVFKNGELTDPEEYLDVSTK